LDDPDRVRLRLELDLRRPGDVYGPSIDALGEEGKSKEGARTMRREGGRGRRGGKMIDRIGKSAEDRGRDDDARRSAIERASGATERRTRVRSRPASILLVDRGRRRTVSVSADVGPATSIPLILLMPPRGAKPCGLEAIDPPSPRRSPRATTAATR